MINRFCLAFFCFSLSFCIFALCALSSFRLSCCSCLAIFGINNQMKRLFIQQIQLSSMSQPLAIKEGIIDLQYLCCAHCKKLCENPYLTGCCQIQQLLCRDTCSNVYKNCPYCNRPIMTFSHATFITRMYDHIRVQCSEGCSQMVTLKQLSNHSNVCEEASLKCVYCQQKMKFRDIPEHVAQQHEEECLRILTQTQKLNEQKVGGSQIVSSIKEIEKPILINPFEEGIVSRGARLCSWGRLTCGKQLYFVRNLGSSHIFSSKKKQSCSANSGSCGQCMALDIKRLGLPKGYLLNFEGKICLFLKDRKIIICGLKVQIMQGMRRNIKVCNEEFQCAGCNHSLQLIRRGMYQQLIELIC